MNIRQALLPVIISLPAFLSATCSNSSPEREVTIAVDSVEIASDTVQTVPLDSHFIFHSGGEYELINTRTNRTISYEKNAFLHMIHLAYCEHRPIEISPDDIWLLICQGFSTHVFGNSENLRSDFVSHTGKKDLIVELPPRSASSFNDKKLWVKAIDEFCDSIKTNLNQDMSSVLLQDFSTSTNIERTAFHVVMMDSFEKYFRYLGPVICGIPYVKLRGTPEDWETILENSQELGQFELSWWIDSITPVLSEFVEASKGNPSEDFWKSMYSVHQEPPIVCGPDGIYRNGWIFLFFPYLDKEATFKNPFLDASHHWRQKPFKGFLKWTMTDGISAVDFLLETPNNSFQPMQLVTGFLGISQDSETKLLKPVIGWGIRRKMHETDYPFRRGLGDDVDEHDGDQQECCP